MCIGMSVHEEKKFRARDRDFHSRESRAKRCRYIYTSAGVALCG